MPGTDRGSYPRPDQSNALVPRPDPPDLPGLVRQAGPAAVFAAEEFFYAALANEHTRNAYRTAVERFLADCERRGLTLERIALKDVGQYFDRLRRENLSIASRKLHLAALRHFFDALVRRHAILLNPALSVRGERYAAVEGKTPKIAVPQARRLLSSIDAETPVARRDRAVLALLAYTASRAGAVAKLRRSDLTNRGGGSQLRFSEKGGRSRQIPVRGDLEKILAAYLEAAGLENAPADTPLFRAASGKTGRLSERGLSAHDIARMMKRRLHDASLPSDLSPHSFRVAVITDLLTQGVPLEDVQRLAGHADPRTTRLYDRRHKKVTRNIVERISI